MFDKVSIRPILVGLAITAFILLGLAADSSTAAGQYVQLPEPAFSQAMRIALPEERQGTEAVSCTDTACPTAPTGLDKCVDRAKFCVYYTTASISQSEAEWAADTVEYYWDRFVELGFGEPKYSGHLEVQLLDIPGDCNGGSGWYGNYITTYAGCFDVTLFAQKVLGHELTHRLQYAHDTSAGAPINTKFLKEGTARATEDNWFTEIDHWAAALSHSSFNTEANNYLLSTENDITSIPMRYKSALWWKYAMEQYGTDPHEPELGIDFVQDVYDQATAGYAHIAGVNRALSGTGFTFDMSFKDFGAAIWIKDLAGAPSKYNFIDEEEAGNPAVYGPLAPHEGGTIQVGTTATWNNQPISMYSLHYYRANVGADCPIVTAAFHRDDAGPAFYHIVTQDGDVFLSHMEGSGSDWSQSFVGSSPSDIVAIVGSLENSSQVDVSLACADPVLTIQMPNSGAVARVQPSTKFLAQLLVTNGSPAGPVVAGLDNSMFTAQVGGAESSVVGGGFIQEQYWLLIQAPEGLPDDTYDLEISLNDPGTGTPLATATNADSVVYTIEHTDQALVIDRSGSMGVGSPTRLSAAQDAATFYVDVSRDGDGLTVVPYESDVNPPAFAMDEVDNSVRAAARAFINALTPGTLTSIGDGMAEAFDQLKSSTTGNSLCSFVLLSDGMENETLFWSDVRDDVIDLGCPVTTIAFGPESNETLMQEIASDTGGLYFYNDVYVSAAGVQSTAAPADMKLDLGNTYEYAQAFAEDRQRLLAEKGTIYPGKVDETKHAVLVDKTVSEAVFSLDWYGPSYANLELILYDPDGKEYTRDTPGYSFAGGVNHHVGYRINKPVTGEWQLVVRDLKSDIAEIPYQVIVSGQSLITLELLLPDRFGMDYLTGNRVPIYAILSSDGPLPQALVEALVTSRDGTESLVPMYDDGQHDDGSADDGLYGGIYTIVNQADKVNPSPIEKCQFCPEGIDEGSYRVLGRATGKNFYREAMGAFSVKASPDENQNRLPDAWEKEFGLSDPEGDPDHDKLNNYAEYMHGTDPLDPDSDDGGENDGSEVARVKDPLDPADDGIHRPDYLQVQPLNKAVVLHFDLKPEYSFVRLFRRFGPSGDWSQVYFGLPEKGIVTDTLEINDSQYFYYLEAGKILSTSNDEPTDGSTAATEIVASILVSEGVTPSKDPVLPEAHVLINQGALATISRQVSLTFAPYEKEAGDPDSFGDITEVMLSNSPDFSGATWQAFGQGIAWTLDVELFEEAHVYARFKDSSSNLSAGIETASILYAKITHYLPAIFRQ
jgi:hypothetical protein